MKAENWNEVIELLTNAAWTSQDLEEKHGVRSSIELLLRLIFHQIRYRIILPSVLYLKRSTFQGHSFSIFILRAAIVIVFLCHAWK